MSILEQALLGGLLKEPTNVKLICDWLEPKDIHETFHRELYIGILDLYTRGEPVDLATLTTELQPKLANMNIHYELAEFMNNNMYKNDTVYYAKKVLDESKKRDLSIMLATASSSLKEKTTAQLIEYISNSLMNLYKNVHIQEGFELYELMQKLAEYKDDECSGNKPLTIFTGFPSLDAILGGFKEGHLVTIAAGSGSGKSTFGLNILRNVSMNTLTPVLLITLEMSHMEIATTALSSITGIKLDVINSESNADRDLVIRASLALRTDLTNNGVKFKVWSSNNDKFAAAVRLIREHMKAEPKCRMVMIDYPGLMEANLTFGNKNTNRVIELQYMTRSLKNLAMELGIVILIMAQVNRNNNDELNTPYKLKDLRDSSSFAHDANIVMFIQPDVIQNQVKINVAKNRGGKTGVTTLAFKRESANFSEISQRGDFYDN